MIWRLTDAFFIIHSYRPGSVVKEKGKYNSDAIVSMVTFFIRVCFEIFFSIKREQLILILRILSRL